MFVRRGTRTRIGVIVTAPIETPEPDKYRATEFVEKLTNLMLEYNMDISGSHDGDVELFTRDQGRLIGFWPGYVTKEYFRDLR